MASAVNHLREYPLNNLAALATPANNLNQHAGAPVPPDWIHQLQVRAGRCAVAFMLIETMRMNLSYRSIAVAEGNGEGVGRSKHDLARRLRKFFALTIHAGEDVVWTKLKDIVQWTKQEEIQALQDLLLAHGPLALAASHRAEELRPIACDGRSVERGGALRFFRKKRRWTQDKMHEESKRIIPSGISKRLIQRYEKGDPMRAERLVELIKLLGISEEELSAEVARAQRSL